jgi:pimeloyl-ACP methyl ester carboxylesterase
MSSIAKISTVEAEGIKIFYRYAGPVDAPTILLLHGFPASSFMFRNLMPLLATKYRVIAPDLPGFGFTEVPAERNYEYTFANIAKTMEAFVDALSIKKFAVYIFDYGAPTGLRMALSRPDAVAAIVTQNGNAYVEGFGEEFWAPLRRYWANGEVSDRNALLPALELPLVRWQYENGSPHPEQVPPEAYYLDTALMERPGNKDIQLDLFYDYRTNIDLYPKIQEYFRKSDVPVLAAWGKNDSIFIAPGAEAYARDVSKLELHWINSGHFALETNEEDMAKWMMDFFEKYQVFQN